MSLCSVHLPLCRFCGVAANYFFGGGEGGGEGAGGVEVF